MSGDSTSLVAVPAGSNPDTAIARLVAQKAEIKRAMNAVMKDGEHYGVVPGTSGKPSLFQAGADTLAFLFRLKPTITVLESIVRDDLISYDIKVTLVHIPTGEEWAEGLGSCNSREKRYASQSAQRLCPACGKPAIIKGREEYGGGWVCFKKKDGCGAKFSIDDPAVTDQALEASTAGVWDLKNTILKMAVKRAKVAAVLNATGASDFFTQDLEDLVAAGAPEYRPPAKTDKTDKGAAAAPKAQAPAAPAGQTVTAAPVPGAQHSSATPPPGRAPAKSAPTIPTKTGGNDQLFDSPERVNRISEARTLMLKQAPDGLGWHPKHGEAWLKKYFGVTRLIKLSLDQAADALALLRARVKAPESYPRMLEMFHSEKRVLVGEDEGK